MPVILHAVLSKCTWDLPKNGIKKAAINDNFKTVNILLYIYFGTKTSEQVQSILSYKLVMFV